MKINRILSLMLMLILVGSVSAQVHMRIPDTTVTAGDTLMLPIYADSTLTGKDIRSYRLQINHNAARLGVLDVVKAGSLSAGFEQLIFNTTGNTVNIAGAGSTPLSGSGALLFIRFYAKTGGWLSLTFNGGATNNYFNEGDISLTFRNGSTNVQNPPVITIGPNSLNLTRGEDFQYYTSGPTTAPLQYGVVDTSIASIDANGLLLAKAPGKTKVFVVDSVGARDTTNGELEVRGFKLSVHDTSVSQVDTVKIPIYTTSLNGLNVSSGSFEFDINRNLVDFIGVETAGTILDGVNSVQSQYQSGNRYKVAFAHSSILSGSGPLMYICLYTKRHTYNQYFGFNFHNIVFNQTLVGNNRNGGITCIALPALVISPNSGEVIFPDSLDINVSQGTAPYSWTVSDPSRANINSNGVLTVKKGGVVTVTATDVKGTMKTSGNFNLYDCKVELPDTTAPLGAQFTVPVYMTQMPVGQKALSFEMEIGFPTGQLELVGIDANGTYSQGWMNSFVSESNKVKIAMAGSAVGPQNGVLVKLIFALKPTTTVNHTYYMNINSLVFDEGNPRAKTYNGSVRRISTKDIKVQHLKSDTADCVLPNNMAFKAVVTNLAQEDLSAGENITMKLLVNNVQQASEPFVLPQNLSQGDTIHYLFSHTLDLSAKGVYSVVVEGDLPGDIDVGTNGDVLVATSYGDPTFNLGADHWICEGDSVVLNYSGVFTTRLWSTGATGTSITVKDSGIVWLEIDAGAGCVHRDSVHVTVNPLPNLNIQGDSLLCMGDSTVLSVASGYPQYSWSTGDLDTHQVKIFNAGTFGVWAQTDSGCVDSNSITIAYHPAYSVSATTKNVSCMGNMDGEIDLSVSPAGSYSFLWSNNANSEDLTNISAGNYSVNVSDANGCTMDTSFTISQPQGLTVAFSDVDPSCGLSNGSISASASGGTPPYDYSWSTGDTTAQISNLGAGTYLLTVTDTNNCSILDSVTLTNPGAPLLILQSQDASCFGGNDGAITSQVSGGTPPYSYSWTNGDTTANVSGLMMGNYILTVTDAAGCQAADAANVSQPLALSISFSEVDPSCGISDGSISANVSGGTSPYSYSWSTGATTSQISNLGAGTYTLTVTDTNSCLAVDSVMLTNAGAPLVSLQAEDVSCHGGNDGAVNSQVSGGTPPYSYSWTNGDTTTNISGLAMGAYTLTVIDGVGCQTALVANVSQPSALAVSFTDTDPSCGLSNGSISANPSGGTAPYGYMWNTGDMTSQISNLGAGTYSVTVTDTNNCSVVDSVTLTNTNGPSLSLQPQDISCHGGSDGAITSQVSGGTSPYTYSWTTGAATANVSGLMTGTYTLTVTDSLGCQAVDSASIGQPLALAVGLMKIDPTCGLSNGSITASPSGGTMPYSYLWNTGATTAQVSSLAAGTYSVTVTDTNSCSVVDSLTLTNSGVPMISLQPQDVSCHGGNDGAITSQVNGGTAPYTYSWTTGATTANISGLIIGTYTLTVTDSAGCQSVDSANIIQPQMLAISFSEVDPSCGLSNGAIAALASGGTMPYSYLWSTGATTSQVSNLGAGTYTLTVTDTNSCSVQDSITLTNPGAPVMSLQAQDVSCYGGSDGAIISQVSGGTAPYTYSWSTGATTADISGLMQGNYTLIVLDSAGCQLGDTASVGQPDSITLVMGSTPSNGGPVGTAWVNATGGTKPYAYLWNDPLTQTTDTITGLMQGMYTVVVTDAQGCTKTDSVEVDIFIGSDILTPQDVRIYPIPASSYLNIQAQGTSLEEIRVYDIKGRLVYNKSVTSDDVQISVSELPNGIYQLFLRSATGAIHRSKFVKQ